MALLAMFVLSLTGAAIADQPALKAAIFALFLIKAGLVATVFMELRHAHPVWRVALLLLLSVLLGVVYLTGG